MVLRSRGPRQTLASHSDIGQKRPSGRIEVAPQAVATIASRATLLSYGVVGMSSRRIRNGLSDVLPPERHNEGVEVRFENEQIVIDLFVVLEYGIRISEVAHNIMSQVKFSVERSLGITVAQVNVNVHGLHISREVE